VTAPQVGWRALEPPRAATAVMAEAAVAVELAAATARRVRSGARLRAASAMDILFVSGDARDLPWAAGVIYFGVDGDVLLPTTVAPEVPVDLLARAVRQEQGLASTAQLALMPSRAIVLVWSAGTVDAAWLDTWTAGANR